MSVSGATDKSNYYSSLSYTKELGRSVINDYDRITARLNVSQKVNKFIEFATNINIAKSTKTGYNDTRSTGSNYFLQSRNLLWGLYWPTDYLTGADWTARYGSYAYNPLYYNKQWENSSKMLKLSANETVTINILPELVLKSVLSYDNTQTRDHLYYSALHFNGSADNGSVTEMSTNDNKVVSSSILSYNKTFVDKHTLGILIGWEAEKNKTDFQRSTGTNLSTSTLHSVATAGKMDANAYYWGNTMLSALSRIEYNYLSRYFFSASFRRDGSSKLSVNSRWGNFWSVAASWKLNSEKFMADLDYISNLKIRASYGGNGTLPKDNYAYFTQTAYSYSYMQNPGGGVMNIAGPDLQWETNYTTNIAVEFGLFDQRLSGSIEYYTRDSKNLLQDVPISLVTGIGHTLKNVGEINNHGVEIEINGDIIRSKTLTWSAGITASSVKSSVNKLYGGQDIIWRDPTGGDARAQYIYREGKSTLALYGLEWAGVDDETGKNVWYLNNEQAADLTVNGRPATFSYSKASETIIGNIHPKLFGGINTDVKWNNFSAGLNFTYKIGGYTYDGAGKDVADDGYYWERIMSEYQYENRWTPENKTASLPMRAAIDMEDVNQISSRHIHKADYLRLKNITVAYNLPKNIIKKMNVSNVRVYFNGSNLWTWAAFDLYDPEVNEYGTRGWETPISKTYTFGVEFTF